jgi:2,5-diamino-6-(ribosylamino)-4(3H)-pyrimidinone 5'-phosphate reductase
MIGYEFQKYRMRPHVVVNVAMSADGKLSTRERRQVKISGTEDFTRVDRLKAGSDAIMVGIGTVLADNPSLTVKSQDLVAARIASGRPPHPIRIVVDSQGRTPVEADILHKGEGERVIAIGEGAEKERVEALANFATIFRSSTRQVDLMELLAYLYMKDVRTLMVEGGGTIISAFFAADLVDELLVFVGNIIIGGRDAPTLSDGQGFIDPATFPRLKLVGHEPVDDGVLLRWVVNRS